MTTAPRRRRLPLALDWIAALLFCATIAIHLTGGFSLRIGDTRISARRDERALLLAVAGIAVRVLVDRRHAAFGVPATVWRERARSVLRSREGPALHAVPGVWRRALLATLALCAIAAVLMREQIRRWILYDWLPPVRRMRAAARFSILVGLSLSVLAGFGARRLLQRFDATAWRQVSFAVIVTAAVLEARPVLRLQPIWQGPPSIYASVAGDSNVVLAEVPVPTRVESYVENTPFMYFSLWHWRPMLNGYSGLMPPSFEEFVRSARDFPAPSAIEFLHARGVSHVTVNCALFACAPLVDRVEQSGAFRRVATATWQGYPVYLYELRR